MSLMTRLECEPIIVEAVEAVDCKLYALFLTPGRSQHLTILVEKDGGINADDCEKVFDQIRFTCLRTDPYLKNKSIEVASPGVDRPLLHAAHFNESINQWIDIKVNARDDVGKHTLRGYLIATQDESITLQTEDDIQHMIQYNDIAKGKRILDYSPSNREKN